MPGRKMRRTSLLGLIVILLVGLLLFSVAQADEQRAKNVIVLIPDGCSFEHFTLARWFKGSPLATDEILVGAVKTYIADSIVADSAPAASAYATGCRTSDKFISVAPKPEGLLSVLPPVPPDQAYRPLATVAEAARLSGRAVGVVSTSRVSHATPAAFMSHVQNRNLDDDIMEQAVYQNFDVVFGGGACFLVSKAPGDFNPFNENLVDDPLAAEWLPEGKRSDRENLAAVLKGRGYALVDTRDKMMGIQSGRAFGMFALNHMVPEIDRLRVTPDKPSLAEMAAKAMELLSADPDGFFLMIEGSQVDWASHANDPGYLLHEFLMFDQAVQIALDFARKDGQTLLLVMPDHNTGGLSIGNHATDGNYTQMKIDFLLAPLKKMKASTYTMVEAVGDDMSPEKVMQVVRDLWGLEITVEDAQLILTEMTRDKKNPNNAFGKVLCPKYTGIGWTTFGHAGGDVPLAAFGPGRPAGLLDAPEVAHVIAKAMGIDLDQTTNRLFVDIKDALEGADVEMDLSDENNPVVKVTYNGKTAELPANKNLLKRDDTVTELEGVVVYIPETQKAYAPQQAIDLISGQ